MTIAKILIETSGMAEISGTSLAFLPFRAPHPPPKVEHWLNTLTLASDDAVRAALRLDPPAMTLTVVESRLT